MCECQLEPVGFDQREWGAERWILQWAEVLRGAAVGLDIGKGMVLSLSMLTPHGRRPLPRTCEVGDIS